MKGQLFVTDFRQLNANPAGSPDVRRFVVFLGTCFDEPCLDTNRRRYHHANVSIVVMVDRAHSKYFAHEESRFAMRQFFHRSRQRETNAAHPLYVFLARDRLSSLSWSLRLCLLHSFILPSRLLVPIRTT